MDKYNSKLAYLLRPKRDWKKNAITIGQTTYYSVPESEVTPEWRRHEDKHKEQWKNDKLFLVKYAWYLVRYGYYKNPYEIEARKAEHGKD